TKVGNFFDEDEIRRVYYPECEALIKQVRGAKRVVVFDHTLRTASDQQREAQKIRDIVSRAHNDYTEWSGPQRVRDLMGEEAEALLRGRFAIIQVWRPINHPVERPPLASCDAAAVRAPSLAGDERRPAARQARDPGGQRAPLPRPDRPDLWHHLRSRAALVLVSAYAARRGA